MPPGYEIILKAYHIFVGAQSSHYLDSYCALLVLWLQNVILNPSWENFQPDRNI